MAGRDEPVSGLSMARIFVGPALERVRAQPSECTCLKLNTSGGSPPTHRYCLSRCLPPCLLIVRRLIG
jgi:hypothetical protein